MLLHLKPLVYKVRQVYKSKGTMTLLKKTFLFIFRLLISKWKILLPPLIFFATATFLILSSHNFLLGILLLGSLALLVLRTISVPRERTIVNEINKKALLELDLFLTNPSSKLAFPQFEAPQVSILIITFNKAEYTFRCLKSLLAFADVPYEVILVDNASTDSTRLMLEKVTGIRKILNEENLHFLRATNTAASYSNSNYLYFLNNDTEITPMTISSLIEVFKTKSDCGAVGSKLILPNGELQEAGSIIWNDGSCNGYGRGKNPFAPEFSYLREVDFCSGASVMISNKLFREIGGLDTIFAPAYYEETDLCMQVRARGLKVYYQPSSAVIHFEFASSNRESAIQLMKKNQILFKQKWERVLQKEHCPRIETNFEASLEARDRAKLPKILVIDDKVPSPEEGQGYGRAYNILVMLEGTFKTTFFAKQSKYVNPFTLADLQQRGVEVFFDQPDLNAFLHERTGYFDLVFVSRPKNFIESVSSIKTFLPKAKVIYDAEALFFSRAFLQNKVLGIPGLPECEKMKAEEIEVISQADEIVLVSENEKKSLLNELPDLKKNIYVFGFSMPVRKTPKPFNERRDLLFLGAFVSENSPNTDAVLYFVEKIFPLVKKRISCNLIIAGKYPTPSITALSAPDIKVLGFVENTNDLFDDSKLFIVPHRFAGGIPIKLSEAMGLGLPAVTTQLIANQLNLSSQEVGIGATAEEFANEVIDLYLNEERWLASRENSLKFIKETHNPEILKEKLVRILRGTH